MDRHFLGLDNPLYPCLVPFLVHKSGDDLEFSLNVLLKVIVSISECLRVYEAYPYILASWKYFSLT